MEFNDYPLFSKQPLTVVTSTVPLSYSCLVVKGVHGKKVHIVDHSTPSELEGDAMITKEVGLPLMLRHADCQVAILYDKEHHALGVVHAGWRGQALKIYSETVQEMEKTFRTDSEKLLVALSPSLGPTKSEFKNYREELSPWMWPYEETHQHFNLWKIAEAEFLSLGIKKENISLPTICTFLDTRFHSYRRDKTTSRNHTVATLLSQ